MTLKGRTAAGVLVSVGLLLAAARLAGWLAPTSTYLSFAAALVVLGILSAGFRRR